MTPTTPPPTTIDFAQVRSRCPKAFAALEKHLQFDWSITDSGHLQYLIEEVAGDPIVLQYNTRDLFDFFDQQGVYVTVMGEHNPYEEETTFDSWITTFSIGERSKVMFCSHPTRAAAEAAAFTAGFEKLQEMLTNKSE